MHAYPQYKLSEAADPPQMTFISMAGNEGFAFFESLARYINKNPPRPQDMAMLGVLEVLGIAPGRPFKPDARMKKILNKPASIRLMCRENIPSNLSPISRKNLQPDT